MTEPATPLPPEDPVDLARAPEAPPDAAPHSWLERLEKEIEPTRDTLEAFFFGPTSGEAGSLFRIGFGLLVLWYLFAGVGMNLTRYYSEAGVVSLAALREAGGTPWTLLALSPKPTLLHALWGATVLSGVCFTIGLGTRIAAAALWIGTTSFYNRNPWLMNAGDHLVCILCFLSIFAPLGRHGSVSAWWRARSHRPPPPPALMFGIAIIQLEIAFVYFSSFVHKVSQRHWRRGEAVGIILDSARYARGIGIGSEFLERVLTYGTLVVEALFFLCFYKRLRPWVLASGVAMHLSIEALMRIPMFSAVMIVSYLAILDDREARWIMDRLNPFRRSRSRPD